MSQRVNFYDFKSNWSQFEHLFHNEEFITAVNIFHWWAKKDQNGIDCPLIENDRRDEDDMRGSGEDDIKFTVDKLAQKFSTSNPYWFTCPGECIELNNLVTYTLLKLMFPDKTFYSTIIYLNGEAEHHNVITCKEIKQNSDFVLDLSLVDDNEGLILYDLIYPLCFWFGKTFESRESVTFITIDPNYPTEEEWYECGYTSYFEEHGIPYESNYIYRYQREENNFELDSVNSDI